MNNSDDLDEYMPDSLYLYSKSVYPDEEYYTFYGGYIKDVWGDLFIDGFYADEDLNDYEQ